MTDGIGDTSGGPADSGPGSHDSDRARADGPGAFPADAIDAVERAFSWLCSRPHPVTLDGRRVAGLPDAAVPLDEVRARLLDAATPAAVRDAVWAHLIGRARTDGPSWTVAAAGMARPMLSGLARQLTAARFEGDPADVRAELVAGFLTGLRGGSGGVDPDRHPLISLRWAAWRAGHAAVLHALDAPRPVDPHRLYGDADPGAGPGVDPADPDGDPDDDPGAGLGAACTQRHRACWVLGDDAGPGSRPEAGWGTPFGRRVGRPESGPPPASLGHPDVVLARAVRDGVLTVDEAALIGTSRLEPVPIGEIAAALGTGAATLYARRSRAEARLVAHLTDPGPDPHDPSAHPSSHRSADPSAQRAATGPRRRRRTRRRGPSAGPQSTASGPAGGGPVGSSVGGSEVCGSSAVTR